MDISINSLYVFIKPVISYINESLYLLFFSAGKILLSKTLQLVEDIILLEDNLWSPRNHYQV